MIQQLWDVRNDICNENTDAALFLMIDTKMECLRQHHHVTPNKILLTISAQNERYAFIWLSIESDDPCASGADSIWINRYDYSCVEMAH